MSSNDTAVLEADVAGDVPGVLHPVLEASTPAPPAEVPSEAPVATPATTPEQITSLNPGEYIVVGTNIAGMHGGGAARYAHDHFGLVWGCGEGLSGQSYALPTMEGLTAFRLAALKFAIFAEHNPDKTFYLTRVGCGIAGYEDQDVAPMFEGLPSNVIKPAGW